ncbi:MAG: hypothetical protein ACI93R_000046 [Flavobacteriales bacterium]|jgi:hypothetical protein
MSGFRRYGRTPIKCAVRLSHNDYGDIVAETRDISESGVFVRCKNVGEIIQVGDKIDAQLFQDEKNSSNSQLKVIRTTNDGVGLSFEKYTIK